MHIVVRSNGKNNPDLFNGQIKELGNTPLTQEVKAHYLKLNNGEELITFTGIESLEIGQEAPPYLTGKGKVIWDALMLALKKHRK